MRTPASERSMDSTLVRRLTESSWVAWCALGSALVVLAITVIGGTLHLRLHLREHLAQRDGEILTAVALARQYVNGTGVALRERLANPAEQLVLALEVSQLKEGVLGVRLFDQEGRFQTAFPPSLIATDLTADEVGALETLQPVSRFYAHARLTEYFLVDAGLDDRPPTAPLLEVTLPIFDRGELNLMAAAQLILDGRPVAREYARVDAHLWRLGLGLYAGGAVLLAGVLGWAYARLRQAHALVEVNTARLLRADHELALAAKASALGSVTAHLVHGLSNPLANLQDYLRHDHVAASGAGSTIASNSIQQMRELVQDTVRMLGEERVGEHYQVTVAELGVVLEHRLSNVAAERGVRLITDIDAIGTLANRHANLILLILENLIQNALRVTPPHLTVTVRFLALEGGICVEVADGGPGVPSAMLPRLFSPCCSTQGGSGLGLAISKQLANQLGARLDLKVNSRVGCVFALTLPASLFCDHELAVVEEPAMPGHELQYR